MSMDKLQKSIIHLLGGDGVFYASLLMQMQHRDGSKLPDHALAGVSIENGRILLHVDPKRLEKYSVDQVARIMEHECLHLVLEHIGRLERRDPYLWNVATDLAVNSLIRGMDLGLLAGKAPFQDLLPKKSADFYYGVLMDKSAKKEVVLNADGSITVKDPSSGKSVTVKPTGDHQAWEKTQGGGMDDLTKEVIKQAVAEAHAQAKAAGKWPAGIQDIVEELLGKEKVNWRKLLKQYIGSKVKAGKKYSWKRMSRRFGEDQKGKLPTRIIQVGIAIDTSGSVSHEEFNEFMQEIHGIQSSYKTDITIVECDAKIQKVYQLKKFMKVDPKFKGRGGTDFRPVFEYFMEGEGRRKKPELLVFFTDLEGPFPDKEHIRTVWVRTSHGYAEEVPFGKLIIIPKDDKPRRNR